MIFMELVRKMLTVKEASEMYYGVSQYRIREMLRKGELPYMKAGNKYLIPEDALKQLMSEAIQISRD